MAIIRDLLMLWLMVSTCAAFGAYNNNYRDYNYRDYSSEEDNTVLRSYRRCMWEQSKFLPRRLVLLSLCSNLFCENNQLMSRSRSFFALDKRPDDCLDILPDQCIQGDEEDLMYKPFPDCCPVYCNLKRRMNRLKNMHQRHRMLLTMRHEQQESQPVTASAFLKEYYHKFT